MEGEEAVAREQSDFGTMQICFFFFHCFIGLDIDCRQHVHSVAGLVDEDVMAFR